MALNISFRGSLAMAENENKDIEFKQSKTKAKDAEANGKNTAAKAIKKDRKSLGWWFGVIVLILIAITFVLPAAGVGSLFGGNSNGIVFGKYDGEDIALEYGNYFYNQYAAIAAESNPQDLTSIYSVYQNAYYNTVFHSAAVKMAEEAGYKAVDENINKLILDQNVYADEDGNFSADKYNETDENTKAMIYNNAKEVLPMAVVQSDVSSVLTSQKEKDFVTRVSSEGRTFKYVAFSSECYPDEDAKAYFEANQDTFRVIDISMMTLSSEDEANTAIADMKAGTKTFSEIASEKSIDGYKSQGGSVGEVSYHSILDLFGVEETAQKIIGTAEGEYVEPINTGYGYTVVYVNKAAKTPEMSDALLSGVKAYIASETPDEVKAYTEKAANDFAAAASGDFEKAVADMGLVLNDVAITAPNPSGAQLMTNFSITDANGYLNTASASDKDFFASLFTSEEGTVLGPVASGSSAFIVVEVGADGKDSTMDQLIPMYYDYITSQTAISDLQQSVLNSDKFEDDFQSVFFSQILGQAASTT